MNFYCDSQGVIFHVDAERIFQGSLGANKIRLIGQFPSTAQVLVAYELPDGTNTSPKIMTSVATLEQVQAPNGGLYSIWESLIGATPKIDDNGNVVTDDNGDVVYDLIPAITALYGTVKVQFFVYGASNGKLNGQVLAVASSSFTVEKGVPAEIPEFDLDDGTTLLQNILAVVANYETIVENAAADAQAAANSAAASASAAVTALNGVVKKTGDEMSGPLLFNSSRTINQAIVSANGLEVGVGVDGESVAVDKTEYGNGGITKTEGDTIKSFALPEEGGTLVTEETARSIANEEIAKFDFINIVAELPETGLPNRFYLVPKENGTVTDLFDAYIWVINDEYPDGRWEYEGVKSGEIDLTILKDYVKKTDYATDNTAGVVLTNYRLGTTTDKNGVLSIRSAPTSLIDAKDNAYCPIVPLTLDYAVKVGITTNTETLTDEEKVAVANWLASADTKNGQIVSRDSASQIVVPLTPNASYSATSKQYVDTNFVAKITTANRLYSVNAQGETVALVYATAAQASTVAFRDCSGQILVGDPTNAKSAANKGYVDDGFVAKRTTTVGSYAYAFDKNGQKVTQFTPAAVDYTLVQRREGSTFDCGTPTTDAHVANKKYVDENKGTKLYLHKFPIKYDTNQDRYLSFISTSSKKQIIDYSGDGNTYTLDFYFDGWNIHVWSSDGTTKLSNAYSLMNLSYTNYNLYTTPATSGVSIDISFESLTDEKYTVTAL